MKDPADDLVEEFNACDGFRVIELARGNDYRLYLGLYQDGEMVEVPQFLTDGTTAIPLAAYKNPTPEQIGEVKRTKLFAEAICRYLNSGGTWDNMKSLVALCRVRTAGTNLSLAQCGYRLLDTCINQEGSGEHVFAAPGERQLIRWVEDSFIDTIPDHEFKREQEELE